MARVSPVEMASQFAVFRLEGETVMAWQSAEPDELSERVEIKSTLWSGPVLTVTLENGQKFEAIFTEKIN